MKHQVLIIILLIIPLTNFAQENATQIEYFIDVDNGFGQNTLLDITSPNEDITESIITNIPVSTTIGYHKLYFRAKDNNGNWSHTFKRHIEIVEPYLETNVILGEYFIDEDYQYGTGTTFSISPKDSDIEEIFSAQLTSSLSLGYHKLYGRVKDSKGNWSQTFKKNILVYTNPDTEVTEIEYFFDEDSGFAENNTINVTQPSKDNIWTFNVPYDTGNYNFNDILFIRVKDSNGNWSITTILDELGTLSTQNPELSKISLYPNPIDQEVNIKIPSNIILDQIKIYNITGKKVFESTNNDLILDLNHLASGLYILKLNTNAGNKAFKILKQ